MRISDIFITLVLFAIDPLSDEFTYLLDVAVDNSEDYSKIEKYIYETIMPGELYPKFTTPLLEESRFVKSIRDTWKIAFDNCLPSPECEFDETRFDFEYYNEWDHFYQGKGLAQMNVYIPI